MANNRQNINNFFGEFDAYFLGIVPNVIAETATEYFQERFRAQDWDGVPWQPLNPKYAAKKTQGRGRILTKTATLARSIRPTTVSAKKVTITAGNSRTPYARAHNEGLRINTVANIKPYTNTNFMGKGKRVPIPAHTRKIDFRMPKRQYMGRSVFLNQQIKARLIAAWNASNR